MPVHITKNTMKNDFGGVYVLILNTLFEKNFAQLFTTIKDGFNKNFIIKSEIGFETRATMQFA